MSVSQSRQRNYQHTIVLQFDEEAMNAQPIQVSDVVGLVAFASFGLWCVFFPGSVISFYAWFHRGKVMLPKPIGVRLVGALWVLLLVGVAWFNLTSKGARP